VISLACLQLLSHTCGRYKQDATLLLMGAVSLATPHAGYHDVGDICNARSSSNSSPTDATSSLRDAVAASPNKALFCLAKRLNLDFIRILFNMEIADALLPQCAQRETRGLIDIMLSCSVEGERRLGGHITSRLKGMAEPQAEGLAEKWV
jgi:hypothetical protein